jgi:predicted ArsR family transcriptional regulator
MADATISAAGMRIVNLLVGNPSRTVADLIEETGVTRTAVTEQLNELVAAGFVEREIERLPGRGRPRNRYSATDAALLLLFASHERRLGPAIWKAIASVGGDELTNKVCEHVSRALAERYLQEIDSDDPGERLRRMNDLLTREGVLVEIDEKDGQLSMHKRSCPFFGMYEEMRNVCCMDEMIMTRVVGKPVKRTLCRHDGDPCCVFVIDSSKET